MNVTVARAIVTVTAAVALLASTPSLAATKRLPEAFIGTWCPRPDTDDKFDFMGRVPETETETACSNRNSEELVFAADGRWYKGREHACEYTIVKQWRDWKHAASTKRMGAPTARLKACCGGGGATWREKMVVTASRGTLIIVERWTSMEVSDQPGKKPACTTKEK